MLHKINWPIAWTVFRIIMFVFGFTAMFSYLINLKWILGLLGFFLFFGCWITGYFLLLNMELAKEKGKGILKNPEGLWDMDAYIKRSRTIRDVFNKVCQVEAQTWKPGLK